MMTEDDKRRLMARQKESEEKNTRDEEKKRNQSLTVRVEMEGDDTIPIMEMMSCIRGLCGGLMACRVLGPNKYEATMSHPKGKERLMEGFKINGTTAHVSEISNDELVVSFLNLPYYIEDSEIIAKLLTWGVSAVSPIKRRMWPGTKVADGTRYVRVKFNQHVQSLPYSTKFNTALGAEYFRVLHDKQVRVCKMCMQPGHILRDCPEFMCHQCGVQGHYARECAQKRLTSCALCKNKVDRCICNVSEEEMSQTGSSESDLERKEEQGCEEQDDSSTVVIQESSAEGPVEEDRHQTTATSGPKRVEGPEERGEPGGEPGKAAVDEVQVGEPETEPAVQPVQRKPRRSGRQMEVESSLDIEEGEEGEPGSQTMQLSEPSEESDMDFTN